MIKDVQQRYADLKADSYKSLVIRLSSMLHWQYAKAGTL